MNPLSLLVDIIPAKYRKYVYAVLAIGMAVFGIWQATDHNWSAFIAGLVTAAVNAMSTANTNVKPALPAEGE